MRWADFLANFDITFQYRRGKDNIAVDALSRKTADTLTVKAREAEDRTFPLISAERISYSIAAVMIDDLTEERVEALRGTNLVDLIFIENRT